jgi:hypothetical protein
VAKYAALLMAQWVIMEFYSYRYGRDVPQEFWKSQKLRYISVIEDSDVINKILKHLGLCNVKRKPWSDANAPPIDVLPAYDEKPESGADDYIKDPELYASIVLS